MCGPSEGRRLPQNEIQKRLVAFVSSLMDGHEIMVLVPSPSLMGNRYEEAKNLVSQLGVKGAGSLNSVKRCASEKTSKNEKPRMYAVS
jgi:hypothetical protein